MENQVSASVVGFEQGMRHVSTNKQGLETTVIRQPRKVEVVEYSNEKEFIRCTFGFNSKGERRVFPEKIETIKLANGIENVRFFNTKEEEDFLKFKKHHAFSVAIIDGSFEAERAKWLESKTEKLAAEFGKSDMNLRSFATTKRVAIRNEAKAIQAFNYDEKKRQAAERALIAARSKPKSAK
mgnify:CR=1 FL=1